MKKVVLKVELYDDKVKQKAMKVVSGLSGVDSIAMDMKDKKLTVTGDIDPVTIVGKLRKLCHTEIVTVGPAKEPEKKKEDGKAGEVKKQEPKKKDDPKKEEPKKKDDPKKEEPKKKDEPKKDEKKKESKDDSGSQDTKAMAYPVYTQPPYYPQQQPPYYPQHHPYYPPQQPYYPPQQQVYYNQQAYSYQQSPVPTHYYYHRSVEEDPNSCVIC